MSDFKIPQPLNLDRFTRRLTELRSELRRKPPEQLAEFTGSDWCPQEAGAGEFQLLYWERPIRLTYPQGVLYKSGSSDPASDFEQALLLYYFCMADGSPVQGEWISFSELPDGKFYVQAYQGYTGSELSRAFGNQVEAFAGACQALGGERHALGDVSFRFQALPRVPLLVVYWQGDEDFPASAQVLFDSSASRYLTTDACAILGSAVTRRILANKGSS